MVWLKVSECNRRREKSTSGECLPFLSISFDLSVAVADPVFDWHCVLTCCVLELGDLCQSSSTYSLISSWALSTLFVFTNMDLAKHTHMPKKNHKKENKYVFCVDSSCNKLKKSQVLHSSRVYGLILTLACGLHGVLHFFPLSKLFWYGLVDWPCKSLPSVIDCQGSMDEWGHHSGKLVNTVTLKQKVLGLILLSN